MKNKSDDRRNNVENVDNIDKIQYNISNTIENFHVTEKAIEKATNDKTKNLLEEKNEVRKEAVSSMRAAIKERENR